MLGRLFKRKPESSGTLVIVRLNDRIMPIDRALSGIGSVHSHWQGPTETALYVYGRKASEMRAALQPFLHSYPLCHRARVVPIVS